MPTITQNALGYRYGTAPNVVFTAVDLVGSPRWKASKGEMATPDLTSTEYASPNRTQDVLVTLYDLIFQTWQGVSAGVNQSDSGATLSKSVADGWGTGATSVETATDANNCMLETVVDEADKGRMISLQWGTPTYDPQSADCNLAIILNGDSSLSIAEHGSIVSEGFGYETGDRLQIWIEQGVVSYRAVRASNGVTDTLRTFTPDVYPITTPPFAVASLYSNGATLRGLDFWPGTDYVATAALKVYGTFPVGRDNWGIQSKLSEKTEVSTAEDDTARFGVKLRPASTGISVGVSDSLFSGSWPITCGPLTREQYFEARDFLLWHGQSRPFFFEDLALEELTLCRVVGEFDRSANGAKYFLSFNLTQHQQRVEDLAAIGIVQGLFGDSLFGETNFGG